MLSLKFRLNLFMKNKLVFIVNSIFCLYILAMLISLTNNPTLTFQILFNLIPFYVLISCINGYFIGSLEEQSNCKELFHTINNSKSKMIKEKLLLGMLIVLFWFIVQLLIASLVIITNKYAIKDFIPFYTSCIPFILIPELIFTIIGIFIGDNLTEDKSFLSIILIWLSIIPINRVLYNYFETISLNPNISWYTTLGFMYSNSFDSITGAYNQIYEYAKLGIFLGILLFVYIKVYKKHSVLMYSSLVLLLGVSLFTLSENKLNISDNLEKKVRTISWYNEDESVEFQNEKIFDQYNIVDYNAEIFPGNTSDFLVSINVELKESTDFLSLMLYNGFEISHIKADDGVDLPFERHGDFINVDISKINFENIKLNFAYTGKSEQHAFINDSGMNLFSRFAYLPTNIIKPAINRYTSTIHDNLGADSYYNIKVNTEKKVFSNLEELENNVFSGYSSQGVILISGDNVQTKTIENVEYYYPKYSNEFHVDIESNMVNYRNSLQECLDDFFNYFNSENKITLEKMFLFNRSYSIFSDIVDNSFITYLGVSDSIIIKDNFETVLNSIIHTDVNTEAEHIKKIIFNQVYYEILYGELNLETIENDNMYISMLDTEEKHNTYRQTFELISELTIDQRKDFMKDFLNLFEENISFEKLDKLIKSYK